MKHPRVRNDQADVSLIAHVVVSQEDATRFGQAIANTLTNMVKKEQKISGLHVHVSVTQTAMPFGPMVDCKWAAAALPCNMLTLRWYLNQTRLRLDPTVYRLVKNPGGPNIRIRLLSLHDLRILRGHMLRKGPGKDALLRRGDIL